MLSDEAIVRQFYGDKTDAEGHKTISESLLRRQKEEDELNWEFYNGDRAAYTHEMSVENQKLAVCFNRVKPYIHSFAGFAAQNRRQPEYFAIEKDDQQRVLATETANKMLSAIRSSANADQLETKQDITLGVCGYAAIIAVEDYMRNPDGEILFNEVSKDFWWDPYTCQPGMGDRRWEYLRKRMSAVEAVKMLGGKEEDFEAAHTASYESYKYWPEGGSYDKIAYDWVGTQDKGMVYVYEYHWYDLEPYYRIKNPVYDEQYQVNGVASLLLQALDQMKQIRLTEEENEDLFTFNPRAKILAVNKEQLEDIEAIFTQLGIPLEYDENLRKCYYEAVLSGNRVFKKRKSVDQSGFAIKVKTADYDHKNKLWTGMVSSLREPAKYANKSVTEFLLILAGTAKPGFFYNISMIPDPAAFEANAARNKKALGVQGNPHEAIRDKQQAALPNGYDTLYPIFVKALSDVIGFAPEALGMGDLSQPSAELEQQRIKQVMTTLAVYFDAITLYQKEHARSMLYFMRRLARNNEGRAIPILDSSGERKISEIYSDMIADEYTIDIGEMPDTPTMRKEQGLMMQTFADKVATLVPQKAAETYALAVEYLPIAAAEKAKWRNLLVPPQDPQAQALAAQEAEKQKQIQEAMLSAEIQEKTNSAMLKAAQVKKTIAEADQVDIENIAAATVPEQNVTLTI